MDKIRLSDQERAKIRRQADKCAWVGVIKFSGPRGRRYRPVRTGICITEERVQREVAEIKSRRYANGAYPHGVEYVLVNQLGEVI